VKSAQAWTIENKISRSIFMVEQRQEHYKPVFYCIIQNVNYAGIIQTIHQNAKKYIIKKKLFNLF
jgi:hypothetical protein